MQIDFHHGATYALARLAGFEHNEASIIAHSSQYVDDAVKEGVVNFTNNVKYQRIASAHKMLDYKNMDALDNQKVWVPFHFLPGNSGLPVGDNPDKFIKKLVCEPNSYVSTDMIEACIKNHDKQYGLYQLGITMHVYGDTWAHYGFAGVKHKINRVEDLVLHNDIDNMKDKIKSFFSDLWDDTIQNLLSDVMPMGHGAALTCPDLPYLNWEYTNGLGDKVIRNNPVDFYAASFTMFEHMCNFRKARGDENVPEGISEQDAAVIKKNINTFKTKDEEARHNMWLDSIASGEFSFGDINREVIEYHATGEKSWKYEALELEDNDKFEQNIKRDDEDNEFEFKSEFMMSHWKLFHDALQSHHFGVARNILPKYGICIA